MLARDMSNSEVLDMRRDAIKGRKRQIHALRERVHGWEWPETPEETRAARNSLRRRVARSTGRALILGRLCRCELCTAEEWRPIGAPERRHPRHCRCEPCLILSALYRRTGD